DLNQLAQTLAVQRRTEEALALVREAVALAEGAVGPRHPLTLRLRGDLVGLLIPRDPVEARARLEVLRVEVPATFGEDSTANAGLFGRLGLLEMATNQYEAGIADMRRSAEILAHTHGELAQNIAAIHYMIGYAYLGQRDFDAAEGEFREALAIEERFDPDS